MNKLENLNFLVLPELEELPVNLQASIFGRGSLSLSWSLETVSIIGGGGGGNSFDWSGVFGSQGSWSGGGGIPGGGGGGG